MELTQEYSEGFSMNKVEADRLDVLNVRMHGFFGGKLTVEPIKLSGIKTVLELGAGSGAWSLDAATILPEAKIVA
ncbi:unnamed protein product [Peniophora sp. CBMAI 1063]|nr:unnamed protein product [Peniophora sp. CBMAI 1063]